MFPVSPGLLARACSLLAFSEQYFPQKQIIQSSNPQNARVPVTSLIACTKDIVYPASALLPCSWSGAATTVRRLHTPPRSLLCAHHSWQASCNSADGKRPGGLPSLRRSKDPNAHTRGLTRPLLDPCRRPPPKGGGGARGGSERADRCCRLGAVRVLDPSQGLLRRGRGAADTPRGLPPGGATPLSAPRGVFRGVFRGVNRAGVLSDLSGRVYPREVRLRGLCPEGVALGSRSTGRPLRSLGVAARRGSLAKGGSHRGVSEGVRLRGAPLAGGMCATALQRLAVLPGTDPDARGRTYRHSK